MSVLLFGIPTARCGAADITYNQTDCRGYLSVEFRRAVDEECLKRPIKDKPSRRNVDHRGKGRWCYPFNTLGARGVVHKILLSWA